MDYNFSNPLVCSGLFLHRIYIAHTEIQSGRQDNRPVLRNQKILGARYRFFQNPFPGYLSRGNGSIASVGFPCRTNLHCGHHRFAEIKRNKFLKTVYSWIKTDAVPFRRLLNLVVFLPCLLWSQDNGTVAYGRAVIDSLSSGAFAGRGYVDNGMRKSANFIAHEFEKIGLDKLGNSYFQEFTMPINILKNAELTVNGKDLKYGTDFLVKPSSKSQSFHAKEVYTFFPENFAAALHSEPELIDFIQKDFSAQKGKHIVFPPHQFEVDSINQYYKHWPNFYMAEENRGRAIFYFTDEKLTASLSQIQDSISEFIIHAKHYSKDLNISNYTIESKFIKDYNATNVIGQIEGGQTDSLIVITAHYDHLGKVGNVYFPGASDNASGTAFLLSLAKYFSENKPKHTLVFIAFGAEEAGLVGSRYFVAHPLFDLNKVKLLLNFDIMGAGEDGIQVVNSTVFTKEYELLNRINTEKNYLKQIKKRGEACNSDHCPFYERGIPSFFIYTLGGPGHYHDVWDTSDSLSLAEFEDLQRLFIDFINRL